MVNRAISRKKILAIAIAACLCALVCATPAYAFFYVHGGETGTSNGTNGVVEVLCTVDATAQGKGVWTEPIFVPANGGTAANCLQEAIHSSESQEGLDAIHNYDYTTMKEFVAEGTWTCTVYSAETQKPGTQTTQDTAGTKASSLDSTTLQRYDHVVFKAA